MTGTPKRLHRSRADRKVAGVLGGIAEYFGFDPSWVRIGYVVLTIVTGVAPPRLPVRRDGVRRP
jgi:phage shock protein PspC (stress-responsive transcriptional regulator)